MSHPPHEDWDQYDVRGRSRNAYDGDFLGLRAPDEHDESLASDVLDPVDDEPQFRPRRRRRRSPVGTVVALLVAGLLVVTASVYTFGWIGQMLPSFSLGETEAQDYEGSGTGEILVEIPQGAGGGQIAQILASEDVVASSAAFTAALQADPRSSSIQPGVYRMANQMSSEAALARLLDGNYRQINGVTVREGLWVAETFAVLAEATGHEVEDYEAVDPATLGLPEAAEGDLEGFLYPSTYEFSPDSTPEDQLRAMVDLGKRTYAELSIPEDELRDVIIKASIVQGEGMFSEDLPKIARVVENRLEPNDETNGYLQMDSTVHFIYQERGLAGTTTEQRQNEDLHNTYVHPGLPSGPINSPGREAIQAVLNPEPGEWLYFVTVDPSTGETRFADDFAGHQENVALFQEWCADNPDQC